MSREKAYEMELESLKEKLSKGNHGRVLLQFPDGFKPFSKEVVDELKSDFPSVNFFIYFGSCFGACDIPFEIKKIDLIVQWGHAKFVKEKW